MLTLRKTLKNSSRLLDYLLAKKGLLFFFGNIFKRKKTDQVSLTKGTKERCTHVQTIKTIGLKSEDQTCVLPELKLLFFFVGFCVTLIRANCQKVVQKLVQCWFYFCKWHLVQFFYRQFVIHNENWCIFGCKGVSWEKT